MPRAAQRSDRPNVHNSGRSHSLPLPARPAGPDRRTGEDPWPSPSAYPLLSCPALRPRPPSMMQGWALHFNRHFPGCTAGGSGSAARRRVTVSWRWVQGRFAPGRGQLCFLRARRSSKSEKFGGWPHSVKRWLCSARARRRCTASMRTSSMSKSTCTSRARRAISSQ